MDAVKKLTKIDTRLVDARQSLHAVTDEERRAKAELEAAEAALVAHFEQENVDELHPTELHNKLAAARARAEQPWQQRREGKRRLVQKLEAERAEFIRQHLGELVEAKEPAAYRAAERLVQALDEIEAAVQEWQAVAQHYAGLLSVVDGLDGRDVPELPLDAVRLESARARERGIPTPLPRSLYGGDDADPTTRSAA